MKPEARTMLEDLYALFMQKFGDSATAWDCLLEFLAADHSPSLLYQLNHRFTWLFEDQEFVTNLKRLYQQKLLRSDYHDHLGDIYQEKLGARGNASVGSPRPVPLSEAEATVPSGVPKTDDPIIILVPSVGTGRQLLALHKRAPKAVLFGVEPNLRKLRIALTNCSIHNIPCYLLNADPEIHEIDLTTVDGRHNWAFANNWNPCTEKLRLACQSSSILSDHVPTQKHKGALTNAQ